MEGQASEQKDNMEDVDHQDGVSPAKASKQTTTSSIPNLNPQQIQELTTRIRKEQSMLQRLPPASSYAIHRLKIVRRSLELLVQMEQNMSKASDMSELDQLLAGLSL